jgi:hypothetical protein
VPDRSTAIRHPNVSVSNVSSTVALVTPSGIGNRLTANRTSLGSADMSTYTETNAPMATMIPW